MFNYGKNLILCDVIRIGRNLFSGINDLQNYTGNRYALFDAEGCYKQMKKTLKRFALHLTYMFPWASIEIMIKKKEFQKVYQELKSGSVTLTHWEKSNIELLLQEMEDDNTFQNDTRYQEHMDIDNYDDTPVTSNKVKPCTATVQMGGYYTKEKITHFVKLWNSLLSMFPKAKL